MLSGSEMKEEIVHVFVEREKQVRDIKDVECIGKKEREGEEIVKRETRE